MRKLSSLVDNDTLASFKERSRSTEAAGEKMSPRTMVLLGVLGVAALIFVVPAVLGMFGGDAEVAPATLTDADTTDYAALRAMDVPELEKELAKRTAAADKALRSPDTADDSPARQAVFRAGVVLGEKRPSSD